MKKLLFVMNTMGQAGAETALLALFRRLDPGEYDISLYVLTGQGEMVKYLPEYVHLLNRDYNESSVLSAEGKKYLKRTVIRALLRRGNLFRLFPYLCGNAFRMLTHGKLLADKLLWRVLSDAADRFDTEYDLAVAYLEGGSTYYVADHVKAAKKAAFVHVDYNRAGYTRALDRECYLKFDRIFAVSDEVKDAFLKVYSECGDRTEVFHNILDTERILRMSGEGEGFTDGYDGMRILSVGRLTPQKAYELSIDAMKLLKDSGVKARWYVLGEGDQRKKLEERIRSLKLEQDFILCGAAANPYPYMRQADVYVQASRFEGKSIAIQEAQVLGKAIVTSDCSGNREQVVQGVDGILCQLTPADICASILEFLRDPEKRERCGKAAAKKNDGETPELQKLLGMLRER